MDVLLCILVTSLSNLRWLNNFLHRLSELFGCQIGLSDHSMGIGVSVAAVALGATIIEKHFTLNRSDGGVDSMFSIEPTEMRQLVIETERAWQALGEVSYGPTEEELKSLVFKRSLYVVSDIIKGETFTSENLTSIRPGFGLPPKFIDILIGGKVSRDICKGTPISWDMISEI